MVVVRSKRKSQTQKKKKPRKARPAGNSQVVKMAKMIADPCAGPLVQGFYGTQDGYLSRFRTSFLAPTTTAKPCGYCLWVPTFTNSGETGKQGNIYVFTSDDSTDIPTNTTSEPMFSAAMSDTAAVEGNTIQDPAHDFLSSHGASFRTLSACMSMTLLNRLDVIGGEFCVIDNVPFSTLFADSGNSLMSVDALFGIATHSERLGLRNYEVRFRPSEIDEPEKTEYAGAFGIGTPASTASIWSGSLTLSQANLMANVAPSPNVIGFAWRGFTDSQKPLPKFTLYKVIEWQPTMTKGLTAVVRKTINPSYRERITAWLDKNIPDWTTRASHAAQNFYAQYSEQIHMGGAFALNYGISAGIRTLMG